jgi:hypothetical protein
MKLIDVTWDVVLYRFALIRARIALTIVRIAMWLSVKRRLFKLDIFFKSVHDLDLIFFTNQ